MFLMLSLIFESLSFLFSYCWCFFVVLANASIIAYRFLLLQSLLLHGCCCNHHYRCQSGCCYYYYCSYYIIVTNIASFLCLFRFIKFYLIHLLYFIFISFFDFIKLKFTLNFCNYLFGSVALFYFILQEIK